MFLTLASFSCFELENSVKMEFVNGHFDNTLTAIDESNIWWTVFSDACKGMNVEYETEIFPGKLRDYMPNSSMYSDFFLLLLF